MKLCLVYNPRDSKLRPGAYCSIFKDMFHALIQRFDCWQFITKGCSAKDIDADLIFFFDPHSTHHIEIEGVIDHPAVKMEYWNDLHQGGFYGISQTTGERVRKLGAAQRVERVLNRGVTKIVCAVKYFFHENFNRYFNTEDMLLHFPHAINLNGFVPVPFPDREVSVIGNGATWGGWNNCYDFRAWAFKQPNVKGIKHWFQDNNTPSGASFLTMLSNHAGALALMTAFPVPKYFEIPAAGCVTFAEYHLEYEEMGFKDYESCVYVNKENFNNRISGFLNNPDGFDRIAKAGEKIIRENYTAQHFADRIFDAVTKEKQNG